MHVKHQSPPSGEQRQMNNSIQQEMNGIVNINILGAQEEQLAQKEQTVPFAFTKCTNVEKIGTSVYAAMCTICGKKVPRAASTIVLASFYRHSLRAACHVLRTPADESLIE